MRRVSSEHSRPVSFSAKFSRVHPATTGVTVLEHMERLDAVEAGLKRLGIEDDVETDEEVDVGTVRSKAKKQQPETVDSSDAPLLASPSAQSVRLPVVHEDDHDDGGGAATDDARSIAEEDLVAMSKSMSYIDQSSQSRWTDPNNRANLDWMDVDTPASPRRRIVIAEVSCSRRFP
jgi:phosphatidylinositol 4-kinase type 2